MIENSRNAQRKQEKIDFLLRKTLITFYKKTKWSSKVLFFDDFVNLWSGS